MGNMKDIGLLDCEDRPSIEENFKRVQGGGGNVTTYEIEQNFDNQGNATYTCGLSFSDAYAMGSENLGKAIMFTNSLPNYVNVTSTRKLGKVIVLRFISLTPNSDMSITESTYDFIWLSSGLTKVAR